MSVWGYGAGGSNHETTLTNQSYTSYMLDEAYKGGPLEILVAVLSCAWSYQMIGEHHQHVPGALEHPLYGEWVRGYCSKEYCETTQEIIDLVNELGKDISAEREAHLKEIFENCSRYEQCSGIWLMRRSLNKKGSAREALQTEGMVYR